MRVMYWSEMFWPYIGGVEVLSARLVQSLRNRNYEIIVVTSHGSVNLPDQDQFNDIPIYRFPFLEALAASNLAKLMNVRQRIAKLKQDFKPDLIHINFTGPTVFFHLQTAQAHPAPILLTRHGSFPIQTVGHDTLVEQALRTTDWVTANSAAVLTEARQRVPEITSSSSLIYNGMNMPALPPEPLPSCFPTLLCLGRLAEEKGFDLALDAFALLRDSFPRTRLVIAGDGPVRSALEQQAAELGLTEWVQFIGWVTPDRVPALMNTTTVVVMPSRHEGFGLVALEAALMARPIVATRVGGLPEVVVHQQTGLLVEQDDSKALAKAISDLLADPDMATRMGQAGYHRAQQLFRWEHCVDAYATLYQRLTKETVYAHSTASLSPK